MSYQFNPDGEHAKDILAQVDLKPGESQGVCEKCGYCLEKNSAIAHNKCPYCRGRLAVLSEPKQ